MLSLLFLFEPLISKHRTIDQKTSVCTQKARVKATKDRIKLRLRGLTTEKAAIQSELLAGSSSDRTLLKELRL